MLAPLLYTSLDVPTKFRNEVESDFGFSLQAKWFSSTLYKCEIPLTFIFQWVWDLSCT